MGEVINLNRYRTRRARLRSQKRGAERRAGGAGEQETRGRDEPERVNADFEDKERGKPSPPENTPSAG